MRVQLPADKPVWTKCPRCAQPIDWSIPEHIHEELVQPGHCFCGPRTWYRHYNDGQWNAYSYEKPVPPPPTDPEFLP